MFDQHQSFDFVIHKASFATVGTEWSKRVFPYPHHRLYFVTAGEALLKLKDRDVLLLPEHVYLLPSFSMVEAICYKTLSHYYIHFQDNSNSGKNLFEFFKPRVVISSNGNTRSLYKTIIKHHSKSTPHSIMLSKGSLQLLLSSFFEGLEVLNPQMQRFAEVLDFIRMHFREKIFVRTLANIAGLDEVYFSNTFTGVFGIPPSQYLIKVRLETAQRLLATTDKKIREIALESGFDNEMYFSKLFRQKVGMTPGEYRKL